MASTLVLVLGSGCAPNPPPRWAEGGAPLTVAAARWDRPDGSVEIRANGRVFEGGHLRFVVDRVGRVTDGEYQPFAVLLADGQLVGSDARALGYVGINNASPPVKNVSSPIAVTATSAPGRIRSIPIPK